MAAIGGFALGTGLTPSQTLYQTVAKNAADGFLTNVSALMPSGVGAKKMDRPKQVGRSKHKFVESVVIGGKVYNDTPMSFVASDNYPAYELASQMLASVSGQDYTSYLSSFAQQYGTGKVQSSKAKVHGHGLISIPEEWKHTGNAVETSSLTPKTPKSTAATSSNQVVMK